MTRWLIALAVFTAALALYAIGCSLRSVFRSFALTEQLRQIVGRHARRPLTPQRLNQLAQFQHRNSPVVAAISDRSANPSPEKIAGFFPNLGICHNG